MWFLGLQSLKARLAEYETLCVSLDQVFDHFSDLPEVGLAEKTSAGVRGDTATDRAEDGEGEALLGLFVDNIILKSKQALQEERTSFFNAMCYVVPLLVKMAACLSQASRLLC